MEHQNWKHVETDFETPKVGDSWVALNPYSNPIELKVKRVTKTLIVFDSSGTEIRVSLDTLKHTSHFHKDWDYYPLTSDRRHLISARKRDSEVSAELAPMLRKLDLSQLDLEQKEILLTALKEIL